MHWESSSSLQKQWNTSTHLDAVRGLLLLGLGQKLLPPAEHMQQPEVGGSLTCVGHVLCHPEVPSQLLNLTSDIVYVSSCTMLCVSGSQTCFWKCPTGQLRCSYDIYFWMDVCVKGECHSCCRIGPAGQACNASVKDSEDIHTHVAGLQQKHALSTFDMTMLGS